MFVHRASFRSIRKWLFSVTVVKPNPKKSLWPITKDSYDPVNQSKLEFNTSSCRKGRENGCARGTIGFDFTSDWMKKWREFFKPRLRVVRLSLCASCVTRTKTARNKWPRKILGARTLRVLLVLRISRGHFFLTIFFCVTHDGLSERGTTRSLF